MKLKEVEQLLSKHNINHRRTDNGQQLVILACKLSSKNISSYYQSQKSNIQCDNDNLKFLLDDKRVIVLSCDKCCSCGDW